MKRALSLAVLLALLSAPFASPGAGLVVVEDPARRPPPLIIEPPPHRPVPPPRIHRFAPLELHSQQVRVRIENQGAFTTIEQEFYNPNPRPLEGTFMFPVPKGAQLRRFTMEIGGQPVEAELLPAAKARKIYEDIVRRMQDPALLEYAGHDLFKVRIFPIEAHGKKRVKLSYQQVLKSDAGLVAYSCPLSAARFSSQPIKSLSFKLELDTRLPLKTLYSPTHEVEIRRPHERRAVVGFETGNVRPETDFQLYFATEKDEIGLNLLTWRQAGEDGFFLLLAAPGVDVKHERVVPKDIVFVLDNSGSMAGRKMIQAKKALEFCVENLNDDDRFEVLRFSTEAESVFGRLAPATRGNRDTAVGFVRELRALGGTAIHDALQAALALRPEKGDRPFTIIFLTDGRPTVGITHVDRIVESVSADQAARTRIFCFGIGHDVNTHLLDRIAEQTRAFSQYVLPEEDIEVKVSSFYTKIKDPVLADPELSVSGGRVRLRQFYPAPLPDLFRGEQVVLAGRYRGAGDALLELRGSINGKPHKFTYEVAFPRRSAEHEFIPRLWATRRIGHLLGEIRLRGENRELREEVTELARQYGIVTPYTAYLIVEDEALRNVPREARLFQSLEADREAQAVLQEAWRRQQSETTGESAVADARSGQQLRMAESPATALARGNVEAARSLSAAPPLRSARGRSVPAVSGQLGRESVERIARYTQQSRFVGGRSFYRNEGQWIGAEVQRLPDAKRVRVQFNSPEYFDLLARHPEALPWLALDRNVQFALAGTVYEIHE